MNAPESLTLDLLTALSHGARPYSEVMEAWRTSCPRLLIWEDAIDQGLMQSDGVTVTLTHAGLEKLSARS